MTSLHGVVALLLVIVLTITTGSTGATTSSSNYNAYQYDMTTPQFTPDGRLLQVEYAARASDHSMFGMVSFRHNESMMIVCCPRLVIFHDTILIGWSGILSDTVALLHHVYDQDDAHVRMYGSRLTAKQVATAVATKCQEHSFGGGLRPFGATLWVVDSTSLTVYQTDPSGRVLTLNSDEQFHITGGIQPMKVRQKLESTNLTSDLLLSVSLPMMVQALLDLSTDDKDLQRLPVEVAVISTQLGVHRLTEDQQNKLLQMAQEPSNQ